MKESEKLKKTTYMRYTERETDIKSHLTFAFKALLDHSPKQTSTVITEGRTHVVVSLEAMWHVNLEALFLELQTNKGAII